MPDITPIIPITGTPIDPSAQCNDVPAADVHAEAKPVSNALSPSALAGHLSAGRHCFGGILFRRTNDFGFPEVCFAVKNVDPRAARKADLRHAFFRHHCAALPFIVCSNTETVGEYTVYRYPIGEKEQPLRTVLQNDVRSITPDALFKKLVNLLSQYNNTLAAAEQPFKPLCCITPDTVYLDAARKLRVLPLPLFGTEHPEELPPEAGTDKAGIKSDLYSIAYLYVEVASQGSSCLAEPEDPTVLRMLASIPDWRPSLSQVRSALLNTDAEQKSATQRRLSVEYLQRLKKKSLKTAKIFSSSCKTLFKGLQEIGRDDRRGKDTVTLDNCPQKASAVDGVFPDDEEG